MVTIYDLLEISENASKDEITKAYQNMIMEYHKDPSLSEEINKENEMILNKMKIAYEILINDEKRKKYDSDIAKQRAEELIKGVAASDVKSDESKPKDTTTLNDNKIKDDSSFYDDIESDDYQTNEIKSSNNVMQEEILETVNTKKGMTEKERIAHEKEVEKVLGESKLSKKEQELLQKAAQEEFKSNLKKAEEAERQYNEAYNKAYNDYLKKNGYATDNSKKYGLLYKIKNISIVVIAVVIVCIIAWIIPPIRKTLIEVYEGNYIIKALVDIFISLIKSLFNITK